MAAAPKVAIACQGGGSHAAFAAGVLIRLLGSARRPDFELVGLSGTSGGAMCAALAWRSLVEQQDCSKRLFGFWRDLEVHDLTDAVANFWAVWFASANIEVSPYAYEPIAQQRLLEVLRRHLDLESLPPHHPARANSPKLFVGATDVLNGERVIFTGESLAYDDLIASAAVPPLFRAVPSDGRLYWDGLFTTNPPIREFTDLESKPDELWIIQINPRHRSSEPRSSLDIHDRRNELAGNLSLAQELFFVQKMNELVAKHETLRQTYKPIQIRVVELELGAQDLDYASKVNRSGALIEGLLDAGQSCAERFFDSRSIWPQNRAVPVRSRLVRRA